jgi:5-methylcytosine-specific restriction protein A
MEEFLRKEPRLKLDQEAYRILRLQVLERDAWRCQQCGSMKNLEVHHLKARSQLGHDYHENLITLCNACHSETHGR